MLVEDLDATACCAAVLDGLSYQPWPWLDDCLPPSDDAAPVDVPLNTTATQNKWHLNYAKGTVLKKGTNKIKVLVKEGGFDLSYLRFKKR